MIAICEFAISQCGQINSLTNEVAGAADLPVGSAAIIHLNSPLST